MKPSLSIITNIEIDREYANRGANCSLSIELPQTRVSPSDVRPLVQVIWQLDTRYRICVPVVKPQSFFRTWRTQKPLYFLSKLSAVLLTLTAQTMSQTSIVAIRTPDEIVVAADSRVIDEKGKPSPYPFCKIIALDKQMFFAVSGVLDITDSPYHLIDLAQRARKAALAYGNGSFDVTQLFIDAKVIPAIDKALNSLETETREKVEKRTRLFEYVLFGFEKGALTIHYRSFQPVRGSPDNRINAARGEAIDCPGIPGLCPPGDFFRPLGRNDVIYKFISEHPFPWYASATEVGRFLVTLEIIGEPAFVGPPVDIVRITKDGIAQWIQRKPECDEAKKSPPTKPTPKPTTRRRKRA
jgi:hypothetical protein